LSARGKRRDSKLERKKTNGRFGRIKSVLYFYRGWKTLGARRVIKQNPAGSGKEKAFKRGQFDPIEEKRKNETLRRPNSGNPE